MGMLESCALLDARTQACDEAPRANRMAKQLFGTDGIRGIPGEYPLDDATLVRVGLALGDFLRAQAKTKHDHRGRGEELEGTEKEQARRGRARVLIGRDTRESGPHIAERIARGLETAGAAPVSAGVLTTPGVAWLVHREGFAAGVVISASHNPYHDNGVKLISSSGMKFPDSVEAGLEKFILSSDGSTPVATAMRLEGDEKLHEDYLDGLRQEVLPGAEFSGMKIVLDCANGAASKLAPQLFRSLGAEVVAMNDAPDGRNINTGGGSLHPEAMQKRVVEERAALGVAFDGDADRAIFSSASGRLIDGDGVLLVAGTISEIERPAQRRHDRGNDHGESGPGTRARKGWTEAGAHRRWRPLRAGRNAADWGESGRRAVRPHPVSRRSHHRRRNADGREDRVDRFHARVRSIRWWRI